MEDIQPNPISQPTRPSKNFFKNRPILILIIVAFVTLGLASYTIFNPKLSTTPKNNTGTVTETPDTSVSPNTKPTILALSQRPDYFLALINQPGLTAAFEYLKVWGKTYQGKDTKPLNTVIILLTKTPQAIQEKSGTGIPFSYNLEFNKDVVVITTYLPDSALNSSSSAAFNTAVISIASKMGGTGKTLAEVQKNNPVGAFFTVQKLAISPIPPAQ